MNGKPAIRFRVDLLKYPLDPNSKGSQVQSPMFETRHDDDAAIFTTLSIISIPLLPKACGPVLDILAESRHCTLAKEVADIEKCKQSLRCHNDTASGRPELY